MENELAYVEKVRLYKDMIFTKYRNALVVTDEREIRLLRSEAEILFHILNDYVEVLDGRADEHI